jgi:hypothetical protein
MPKSVNTTSIEKAETEFFYGHYYENSQNQDLLRLKSNGRWGGKPNTFLLNDYEKLMILLHTEEYDVSVQFKENFNSDETKSTPVTKLDKIKEIFEYVISHRKLSIRAGTIDAYSTGEEDKKYNASEMSDGERIVFYLIGEVMCVKENSLIIIDEPENHLHKSIIKKLWDRIEQERLDCTFVYLTHDIDFAVSRQNSEKIWMKSYNGNDIWDYEILENQPTLPEQLYLEVLGSRNPILFIEGDLDSIDYKFYEQIFTEYTVKSIGSCNKVFEATKSFNELKEFHHINSFGLIDRDRRTTEQIQNIKDSNIWVSKVTEVESFLLLEDIIKIVAKRMGKNADEVFTKTKINVINELKNNIEYEATQYTLHAIKNDFEKNLNPKLANFNELENELDKYWNAQNFKDIYNKIKNEFEEIVNSNNYNAVLEKYNNKGLIYKSKVIDECGISTKNNAYLTFIITILKENNNESKIIRKAVNDMIYKK